MQTLKTITTIELSNLCNLRCLYCINRLLVRHPSRTPGIMTDDVFERTLVVLKALCDRGTQREVNMNGNGESCLDPQLPERIRRVKDIVGADRQVGMSTNGVNMTYELARALRDSGLDRLDISPHSAYHARRAVIYMVKAGWAGRGIINTGPINASHNWAGQLEPEHTIECRMDGIPCDPLIEGRGYVLAEGNVTPCCYDYRNLGVFGSVFDGDLLDRPVRPYNLCYTCHQRIPEGAFGKWTDEDQNHQQHRSIGAL